MADIADAASTADIRPPVPVEPLLAAAAEVFAERGYDRAGVAEIARRAGVTTGAIYSRWSGKAELLAEAIDAHTADELDELFTDHRFAGHMEDIIAVAGAHLVKREKAQGKALLLEAFVAARRDPQVADLLRARMEDRRARLTEVVEAAKASGGIDADVDTEALVAFCHAVGFGFVMYEAVDLAVPHVAPWEELITRLVAAVGPSDSQPRQPSRQPHRKET